jgi:hypothetical protein
MDYRPFGLLDMTPGLPAGGVSGRTPTGADDLGRLLYSMTGAGGAQDAAGLLGGPSVRENLKAGNNFDAGIQMLAALPVVGMLGTAGKAAKGAVKVAEEAAPAAEKYITGYHGSPHSFDRFDMSKIGTGEGAQAYGHGLYFAENEGVARQYRDNLSGRNSPISKAVFKEGKEIPWYEVSADDRKLLPILSDAGGDVKKAKELIVNEFLPTAHNRLDRIASEGYELRPHGSMYQVRINADPNAFLDWDKPLSEQSPHVLDRLGLNNSQRDFDLEAKLQYGSPEYEAYMKRIDSRVGAPHNPDVTGAEWYRDDLLRGGHEAERGRSAYLASQGIPGIKYLDAGSRGAGDGSRNYVVFDDSLIDILKKYGLIGLLGGGAAASGVSGMNNPASEGRGAPGL